MLKTNKQKETVLKELNKGIMITFHQIIEIKITKMSKIEILELINASVTFQLSFIYITLQPVNFSYKSSLSC